MRIQEVTADCGEHSSSQDVLKRWDSLWNSLPTSRIVRLHPGHGGGSLDRDEVWFGGTHGTLISSTALCRPRNGGADRLAETESDGRVKRIKDFGLVEQARKVFTVSRWRVGREVAVRFLRAGH